jgi:hypothetical protein
MSRITLSRLSLILIVLTLLGIFPFSASAANNEYVLTSINHVAALNAVDVKNTTSAALTVPHDYPARTVNLANGLDIQYDTTIYSSATAAFPSTASAVVGGDPVKMTVTYQKKGGDAYYMTDYTLRVVRDKRPPAFEGTVLKNITFPGTVRFIAKDFSDLYKQNDGSQLAYISISGTNPSFGKLKFDSADYVMGSLIKPEDLDAGKLTYQAAAAGTVSYIVKAYQSGDTVNPIGAVTLTIVSKAPQDTKMNIAVATSQNTPLYFNIIDFPDIFKKETGQTLSYVKFDLPNVLNGKLYYNYGTSANYEGIITSGTAYSSTLLPYLAFVPDTNFLGSVTIRFTGFTAENLGFNGSITITVSNQKATVINYKTKKDAPLSFAAADFNKKSREATGKDLSHVYFSLPALTNGILYHKYESPTKYGALIKSDIAYNAGKEPLLNDVDFVPAKGFTGTFSIAYTGYNVEGTAFSGEVKITVEDPKVNPKYAELIKKYPWAADAIRYLYDNGIINDESLKKMRPNSSISRGDFILLASQAFKLEPSWPDAVDDIWDDIDLADLKELFKNKDWKKWFKKFGWDDWDDLEDFLEEYYDGYKLKNNAKKPNPKNKVVGNGKDKGNKGNPFISLLVNVNSKTNNPKGAKNSNSNVKVYGNWCKFILTLNSKSVLKRNTKSALSRQDAMVIIYEAMKEAGITISGGTTDNIKGFKDYNKISNYAREAVAKLVAAGIVDSSAKNLNPNKSISQIEAYALLYKALQYAK